MVCVPHAKLFQVILKFKNFVITMNVFRNKAFTGATIFFFTKLFLNLNKVSLRKKQSSALEFPFLYRIKRRKLQHNP